MNPMQPMNSDTLASAALALRSARATRQAIQRISETHGIADLDAAYAVAEINTAERLAQGARRLGLKVGLTSRAVQQQLGVDQPDFGVLMDDMAYLNRDDVPMSRLIQPKVEGEVAFVLGRDLNLASPSYAEFLAALAYALPAIEIVDSAIADWKITLVDTVADNASSGLYVLGDQPVAIGQCDFASLGMTLEKNGQGASVGSGSACLGHPLRAAYWLACTLGQRGTSLQAGQVILSGALGPMVPVSAGDRVHVNIGALGTVACQMV